MLRLSRITLLSLIFVISGCGGSQSILNPAGPSALYIAYLWWAMFIYSTLVLLSIIALMLYAAKSRTTATDPQQGQRRHQRLLIGGGIVLPSLSILLLLAFSIPTGHRMLPLPNDDRTMIINVTGQQWDWIMHYPDHNVTLSNELHLPVGVAVDMHITSEDVIHSFWVPRLAGKIDAIPGRTNILRMEASQTGEFRGQCAEFCGLDHAHMIFNVHAHTAQNFTALMETLRDE